MGHPRVVFAAGLCLLLSACSNLEASEQTSNADREPGSPGSDDLAAGDAGASQDDSANPSATAPSSVPANGTSPSTSTPEQPTSDGAEPASDDPASPIPSAEGCASPLVPTQPLRRLSSAEYHATLLSLFGPTLGQQLVEGSRFPVTVIKSGFSTSAEANVVNTAESNAIEDNAEQIAARVDAAPLEFLRATLPCEVTEPVADSDIDACIDRFIAEFGARAFRRPLTSAEAQIIRGLYDRVRADDSALAAYASLIQYFVQAPALLYRAERGEGDAVGDVVPLTSYERATRLAYLLAGSAPDAALFARAAANELVSPEQVADEAERLLESDQFAEILERFHQEWLELHGFEYKEPSVVPDFDLVRQSLEREQSEFVRHVFERGDGRVRTLLGAAEFPVDSILASYYGVDAPGASDTDWVNVPIPGRRGLLTQASLMAVLADASNTKPIHRGGFIQTRVLCRTLPTLPANLDLQAPLQDTSGLPTARQRLAPLLERADCAGCHVNINPVGLAFEHYDAGGRYRELENGAAIDASGSLTLDGETVTFDDAVGLVEAVASSDEARDCYAQNWFRAALGRDSFVQDACSLDRLLAAGQAADGDVKQLLLALVQTDAFLYLNRSEP